MVFLLYGSLGGWFSVLKHHLVGLLVDKLVSQEAAVPNREMVLT